MAFFFIIAGCVCTYCFHNQAIESNKTESCLNYNKPSPLKKSILLLFDNASSFGAQLTEPISEGC